MNKIFINAKGNATLVLVMIPTGSYYEDSKVKGISHFLEHFCFKGTSTRSRKDIDTAIEGVGGDINAFTDTEVTCYWAKVANAHKNMAIDVITDLALNPIFPAKEIDKEREVIIQELKMYKDSPTASVGDLFNATMYPETCGFHTPIIGTEKTLYDIGRKQLKEYHTKYYTNPTLIVIGDVKNSQKFDNQNFNLTENKIYVPKKDTKIVTRKLEQANVIIGNDVYLPQYSKLDKILMLNVLSLLFNGMSGRLFGKIREENNLVYRIRFDNTVWSGGTISWYVSLGLEKDKVNKARKLIETELRKRVSKKELETTLIKAIGTQNLEYDDGIAVAEAVAYSVRKNVDFRPICYDFEANLRRVSGTINEFIKNMDFNKNLMVGIVPK
jgi:predicted Zn-dependent peptidase